MKKNLVLRRLKIQRSILLVFLFAALTILLFVKLISGNMADSRLTDLMVNHTYEIIKRAEAIHSGMGESEAAIRAYLATGDKRWYESSLEHRAKVITLIDETRTRVIDSIQMQKLRELEQVIQRKFAFTENMIATDTGNVSRINSIKYDGEDRLISLRINSALAHFMTGVDHLLQQRLAASNKAKNKALLTAFIGASLIFMFLLGTLLRLNRDMSKRKGAEREIRESESKYRQLIEEAGVTMFTADLYGTFTYVSSRCHSLTGYTVDELTGKSFGVLILPDSLQSVIEQYQQQVSTLQPESTVEFPIVTKQGHLKWVEQHAVLLYNEFLQATGYQCVVRDVTERKAAEQRIKRSEELMRVQREEYQFRLQSVLDNTPSIVFIKDLKGRYLIINKSFREMYAVTDEQVIGKTDFDFDNPEEAARYKKSDDQVIQTLSSIETEEKFKCHRNGIQHLLLVKFPLFDKTNTIYGVGGIATDFTENVQYRHKLIEAKKKAESAEQLQEQFLANMSHEIRTPMNGITGMTNILMGTKLDTQQTEFVKIIKQSSDSLLFLINDILDLSKIKAGKLTLEKTSFNLREIIENTLAPFHLKAKEKKIDLMLVQGGQLPAMIEGDPYRLTQILNNLLSNAMKFTERGSVKLVVKQTQQTEKNIQLEFSVTDTGVGIPEDKLDSIFNSFEQASSSTTRQFGGTGLGLAITKKLVEMQEGKIGVTSKPGSGATFHFTIQYDLVVAGSTIITTAKETSDIAVLAGKKILIVEDNEINQKVIFHILQKEGMKVTLADNGRDAVTLLENGNEYELIIMDLQMPVMDGFQAAAYIRKKLNNNTPIIAMTASVLRNEKHRCFELGMNEYLSKPFVPAELFVQLKRFLSSQPIEEQQKTTKTIEASSPMYSLTYLQQMDDNESLCEILKLFLDTTSPTLDEIRNEALHENWDMVAKQAHKLKSSLGVLQINTMLELITSIEQQAKDKVHTGKIEEKVKQVTEQYGLIRPMIEAELQVALKLTA